MRRALACLALLALTAMPPAQAAPVQLDTLMAALAARGDAAASFVEEQHLAALDRPLQSSGELRYRAPDELEKRTVTPRAEVLRYVHGVVTSESGGRRRRVDLQRYPQVLPFVESIRATLAGDRSALEKLFEIEASGEESDWELRLTPRDTQGRSLLRVIRVAGSGTDVRRVEIERANGDRSITTITPHAP